MGAVLNGNLPEARSQADKASIPSSDSPSNSVNRIKSDFSIQTTEDAVESVKSLQVCPNQV